MKLIPYFEVDGNRYEIRRNRFLICEFEKMRESSNIEDNTEQQVIKLQGQAEKIDKLQARVDELYDKYLETFSEEAKKMYEQAQALYDKMSAEFLPSIGKNGLLTRLKKVSMDNAEKLVIIALQHNEKGEIIRKKEEAEDIWCAYVNEVGEKVAQEWLNALIEHITGRDEREDENPFLAQAKARAEQAANSRMGITKIKK